MKQTQCFVAGGSGGHIIPALTLAEKKHARTIFFSTATRLDASIIHKSAHVDTHIPLNVTAPPSLRTLWKLPLWLMRMVYACIQSLFILYKTRPESVTSTGGFVSVPVVLAARLLRIPITLYELNVEPGKATLFLARYATTINIIFPETAPHLTNYRCTHVPYPLRTSLQSLTTKQSTQRKTIMILGGSQGSVSLNDFVYDLVHTYTNDYTNVHIIHQTGSHDQRDWNAIYTKLGISHTVFAFHDQIETFYAQTDFIICRSGAGTLCEIEHLKIPCITIPLETSYTRHQRANAYALARKHPQLLSVITHAEITSDSGHTYQRAHTCIMKAILQEPIPSSTDTNSFQLGE